MAIGGKSLVSSARFIGIGFSLGGTVLAALWAGNWLDERLGTSPLFLMILLVGGLFGFTRRLLWMLQQRPDAARTADPRGVGDNEPAKPRQPEDD